MDDARVRFAAARVARLATVSSDGAPHLVPIVFAVEEDVVYSAVDAKPKRSVNLRRLANIAADPRVALLADHYAEDWTVLWWVRADAVARVVEPASDEVGHALDLLAAKYHQYHGNRPDGAVVAARVIRWSGWSAAVGPT